MAKNDFIAMAKVEYERLSQECEEARALYQSLLGQMKPIEAMLKKAGVLEAKKHKKKEAPAN